MNPDDTERPNNICDLCAGSGKQEQEDCTRCAGRGGWPSYFEVAPGRLVQINDRHEADAVADVNLGEVGRVTGILSPVDDEYATSFTVRIGDGDDAPEVVVTRWRLDALCEEYTRVQPNCAWPTKRLRLTKLSRVLGSQSSRTIGTVTHEGTTYKLVVTARLATGMVNFSLKPPKGSAFKITQHSDDATLGHALDCILESDLADGAKITLDASLAALAPPRATSDAEAA